MSDTSDNTSNIASYLKDKIERSSKSQKEIANDMGFQNVNFLSMLKSGKAKVPLDKSVMMARALGIDPVIFMKLALEQFFPDKSDDVWTVFDSMVSANEMRFIRKLRVAFNELDPEFTEHQIDKAVALLVRLNPPQHHKAVPN